MQIYVLEYFDGAEWQPNTATIEISRDKEELNRMVDKLRYDRLGYRVATYQRVEPAR